VTPGASLLFIMRCGSGGRTLRILRAAADHGSAYLVEINDQWVDQKLISY
jgi:hypothetical protein